MSPQSRIQMRSPRHRLHRRAPTTERSGGARGARRAVGVRAGGVRRAARPGLQRARLGSAVSVAVVGGEKCDVAVSSCGAVSHPSHCS
eukprot:3612904-Pyramimonas_sp.AAC.1